ncbi:MAG: DNA helicase RecQ [Clostridia bacterium]|nr:DNA helicase RecQ [Clostridia bacterium]
MLKEAQIILKKYFGYTTFRKGQEQIISSILNGSDTLGIMPTGGGKSICYQIPALLFEGTTLVISPLISLMKDQVDALNDFGIPSTYINSSLSYSELRERLNLAARGKFKLLYIAPERLESEQFRELLNSISVSLLAIDEAHCVSQWGHDFRPSYLAISALIKSLPKRPIVAAFTATATESVKNDIAGHLTLKDPDIFVTGFNRENLRFSVVKCKNKSDFLIDYINGHKNQAGIIYAATRNQVDKLHDLLKRKGFAVGKYHAGLSDGERAANQDDFLYDNINVMVATNAFGMGIDKSNVRYVLHFNMPRAMESYYQEAGRAGRDGEPGECILLYGASDIHIQKFLIEQSLLSPERKATEYKRLQNMVDYCHTSRCLRKYILEYFGEKEVPESCSNCGNCDDDLELTDITVEAQKIFSCVKRMGEQYGSGLVCGVLHGSGAKKILHLGFDKLSTYGIMKDYSVKEIGDLINLMTAEDYLHVTEGQYPVVKLTPKAYAVLKGIEKVNQKVSKKKEDPKDDFTLFDILRSLRKTISEHEKVPPYVIFHDSTLKEMCKYYPTTERAMLDISGVGESKFGKYGQQFIEAIQEYVQKQGIQVDASYTSKTSSKGKDNTPSHTITYRMYLDRKTPEEIAKERDMTVITIQEHLVRCWQEGQEVNWDMFIPKKYEALILQAVQKVGSQRLRPIKDELPDEVDYFGIRAVICKYGK